MNIDLKKWEKIAEMSRNISTSKDLIIKYLLEHCGDSIPDKVRLFIKNHNVFVEEFEKLKNENPPGELGPGGEDMKWKSKQEVESGHKGR